MASTEPLWKTIGRCLYRTGQGLRLLTLPQNPGGIDARVFYAGSRKGNAGGTLVKVGRLQDYFPSYSKNFNIVYTLSNSPYLPRFAFQFLKQRGYKIVLNQNGLFYPAWYEGDWRSANKRMAISYHAADYVFWQSEFCKQQAERFLGARQGAGEILYNAVDINHFKPLEDKHRSSDFTFLITGKIEDARYYRLEHSIRAIHLARQQKLPVRLKVAGYLSDTVRQQANELIKSLGLENFVTLQGSYTQREAPGIYNSADAYLTLSYRDPCPNAVIEALSCDLPVLYSASGGVPELVGSDAGIALPIQDSDDQIFVPKIEAIVEGMKQIIANRATFSDAARKRAVERFNIENWIERHRTIFQTLLRK